MCLTLAKTSKAASVRTVVSDTLGGEAASE